MPVRLLLLLIVGLLCANTAWSQTDRSRETGTVLQLPAAGTIVELKCQAEYLPLDEAPADLQILFESDDFQPWEAEWEASAPPLWLRLHLASPPEASNDWLLQIKRRFFRQLEIRVLDPVTGEIARHSLGLEDYVPGQVSAQDYIVPLAMKPGEERILLMRVETLQRSLSALEFSILDELSFKREQNTRYWAFGLYFGSVIALLIYNLTLYLNLRTPGHRMYVIAIGSVLVFMSLDSGLAQSWLPDLLRQREIMLLIAAAALMMATSMRFFQVFVDARVLVPRLNRVINALCVIILSSSVLALLSPVAWGAWMAPIIQSILSIATFVLLGSSLYGAIRGSSASLVFFVAWAAFLSGNLLRTLLSFEWLPRLSVAEYMVYIGSVMEAMILALGLSYRVGQLRIQRNRAEREQLKAMELANLDSLTGAYNRRFFDSYLTRLLTSDERVDEHGALILFDIDYFKEINDEYGHDAGDAVLQAMTRRFQSELRTTDVLCRLGGDEFALILDSLEDETAFQVAERLHRIIDQNPVMYQQHLIRITISIGVLASLSNDMDEAATLRAADQALYAAKRAGRNQIEVYRPGLE